MKTSKRIPKAALAPCADKVLAIVDCETNGGWKERGQIIEIGMLKVKGGVVTGTFRSLVKPSYPIPPFISGLTGIDNEMLEDAPYFDEIALEVRHFLEGAIFVAHNAGFDYACVRQEFLRLDMPFSAKSVCTMEISRALFPRYRRHDLSSIIARYGFQCDARHRAFDDAKVLWDFLVLAHERKPFGLAQAIEDQLRKRKKKVPELSVEALFPPPEEEAVGFV